MATVTIRSTHTPSGKSNIQTTSVIAAPQPGDWPNHEPASMTTIASVDGSSLIWPGGFWNPNSAWSDPTRIVVVSDAASKHGNAVEKRWTIGDSSGWYALNVGQVGLWRELYIRVIYSISPNYQYHPTGGEKFMYYNQGGVDGGAFVLWHTASNSGLSPSWSDWSSSNTCVPQKPGGGDLGPLTKGAYHTIEIHHGASVSAGEGFLRMWVDDVEHTQFRKFGEGVVSLTGRTWRKTLNEADKRIGGKIELPLFWGGEGGTKSVIDYYRLSEFYISGRN